MYILSANMWFQTLMRQFFFNIDKIVFNFISIVYDLLISIARTSILSQADIIDMADRIYKLLAIFMIFKVTFSLIMYVVNPDDFSDKTKGVSKLGTNIIISLALLILTPYIFSYAYQLQTIILEDNSLASLVFGSSGEENKFLNTAGEDMAFITMKPFFMPNTSIVALADCIELNDACFDAMSEETDDSKFTSTMVDNYREGINYSNLGLTFRQDLAIATIDDGGETYVMDYKYLFSTVVGVIVIVLLVTFCMDVAVRSIKLSFLQLIAPIPIISYVDPKSGKDGLFKKWYQMCFKTYLSLFIRLLALYFAVYIISRLGDMVDIVDGSQQTNAFIAIFIIIGALMFAKQLPKILEGLGIKLDGGGFTLNPLKKFEEGAAGGKKITGATRGALVGTAGALSGAGLAAGLSGAWRGFKSGKGWTDAGKATAEMNRKMRQAKLDGSSFHGRMGARISGTLGIPSHSERLEDRIHGIDERIKEKQNAVKNLELERDAKKSTYKESSRKAQIMTKSMGDAKSAFTEKMQDGVGSVGAEYIAAKETRDLIADKLGQHMTWTDSSGATHDKIVEQSDIVAANAKVRDLEQNGWKRLVDEQIANPSLDAKLQTKLDVVYQDYATANGISVSDAKTAISNGNALNATLGAQAGVSSRAESKQREIDEEYYEKIKANNDSVAELEEEKRRLYERQRQAKADESAIK